jgi:hypothetical protein
MSNALTSMAMLSSICSLLIEKYRATKVQHPKAQDGLEREGHRLSEHITFFATNKGMSA